MKTQIIWPEKTIRNWDKNNGSGLLPDTVLWGMAVNGTCNPHLSTVMEYIAKEIEEIKGSVTAKELKPVTLKGRIGTILISFGNRLLDHAS